MRHRDRRVSQDYARGIKRSGGPWSLSRYNWPSFHRMSENLFLRRQLALYIERGVKPRRIDPATRIFLTLLSRLFDWRGALVACVRSR
jgi:hypothetical protein